MLVYDEMINLIMNVREMFTCRANIHIRGHNNIYNGNYLDRFDILENVINENGLGICFTFFSRNYSILLKQNDFIEFNIKYRAQRNLLNLINMTQIEDYFSYNHLYLDPRKELPKLTIEYILDTFTFRLTNCQGLALTIKELPILSREKSEKYGYIKE